MEYILHSNNKEILIDATQDAEVQEKREERLRAYEKAIREEEQEGATGSAD